MSLSIKDVEDLAELAKLELTAPEKEKLLSDMDGILNYIKQIEEVELPKEENVEYDHFNAWREDILREEKDFSPELISSQFPDSKNGFVKVKKIL